MDMLTEETAALIAHRHWNVRGRASELPSYADRNFLLRGEGRRYVLKIAHESWSRPDIDLENQAMMALATREPSLGCPRVHRDVRGEHLLELPIEGAMRLVRLLDFVPGTTYADAIGPLDAVQRAALHESLGHAVGQLTRGLAGFTHPAAARVHDWNLLRLPTLLGEIAHVDDAALREQVRDHANAFCAALPQRLETFPVAVLHNDANDLNVIVADDGGGIRVGAIIDFGDMCTSLRLADLAIACTYAMQHESDPVACARRIVHGYVAEQPLSRQELESLHGFILARLCQSILMATRSAREQPGNAFVLVSQQGVRRLLRELSALDGRALVESFLESCHD